MAQSQALSEASYRPSERKTAPFQTQTGRGRAERLSFPWGGGGGPGSECSQEEEGLGGSHECLLLWARSRNWEGQDLH